MLSGCASGGPFFEAWRGVVSGEFVNNVGAPAQPVKDKPAAKQPAKKKAKLSDDELRANKAAREKSARVLKAAAKALLPPAPPKPPPPPMPPQQQAEKKRKEKLRKANEFQQRQEKKRKKAAAALFDVSVQCDDCDQWRDFNAQQLQNMEDPASQERWCCNDSGGLYSCECGDEHDAMAVQDTGTGASGPSLLVAAAAVVAAAATVSQGPPTV
jgi:hypothetical protein